MVRMSSPGTQAHCDEEDPIVLARRVDRYDVGMIERRGELRLRYESAAELRVVRELLGEDLQRHRAIEREVGGAVHDAHPASAHTTVDPIAGELLRDKGIRHQPVLLL
jgi:hypothetical protein